jgi:ABC-2 type transport system permease protein
LFSILKKECNSFLDSLIAYLVIGVFLVANGLFMWVLPDGNILDSGFAEMEVLFSIGPYVLMFLIPAVTMRSFAEEKKSGTLELLLTKPITEFEVILGKFFACYLLVIVSIIPTFIYYYSVGKLGNPEFNLDTAGIIGSYIGLIMLSGVFTSIGIFASSISDNQINSFIIAIVGCYVFYTGFSALATMEIWSNHADLIGQFGIASHYASISRGLIDSRDLVYFLGLISFALFGTRLVLESRKWA